MTSISVDIRIWLWELNSCKPLMFICAWCWKQTPLFMHGELNSWLAIHVLHPVCHLPWVTIAEISCMAAQCVKCLSRFPSVTNVQYACTNMPAVCVYEHACSMHVQTCLQYACTNMPAVCMYKHACSMHVRTCLQYACTNMPAVCVYEHACSMRVRTCLQYACTNMPAVRQSDNVSVYHSIFCTVLYCTYVVTVITVSSDSIGYS